MIGVDAPVVMACQPDDSLACAELNSVPLASTAMQTARLGQEICLIAVVLTRTGCQTPLVPGLAETRT